MDNTPSPESNNQTDTSPAPEVLKPRVDEAPETTQETVSSVSSKDGDKKTRHKTYRPSHKATFISLAVVVVILAINAVIFGFVLKRQDKANELALNGRVTIDQSVLDKLGVNRSSVGDLGVGLTIGPTTEFKNKVSIDGDTNIAGQLKVNTKLSASNASLTQLDAGKTALSELNVNGASTVSNLNLRNNLVVTGTTHLQGTVTINQLLTVDNNINVSGNLSIGGTFSAHSLTSTGVLNIGGHVITYGSTPSVSAGNVGSNGTVSISGNDSAGTVAVNVGAGGASGTVVHITFASKYSNTPHVVITPIGANISNGFYVNRSATGFSIGTGSLSPGGYAFDYIVEQ